MNSKNFIQQPPIAPPASILDNSFCSLSSYSLLRLTGADRIDFLHSQLTCDLHKLEIGQASLAAWCNPKGRVIVTFIVNRAEDYIDLLVAADMKDAVVKRLRMFVLRAQVEISDCEASAIIGLAGDPLLACAAEPATLPAADWQTGKQDSTDWLRLPGPLPRLLVYADGTVMQTLWQKLAEHGRPAAESHWTLLNIEARLPWITHSVSEQFLPQMLNLDQNGGLDFNKGCYPGQEVIARLHYRGEVKQRLRYGITQADLAAGEALYTAAGERAGNIVNCAPHPDGNNRCLSVTATGAGQLHAGSNDGPVVDLHQ